MHFDKNVIREGVELSDHFAEIARKRGLTIYNDYLEKVGFSRNYDVVTSYAILEHLEDPLVFLDSLSRILNPSGLLVILIPYYGSLKRSLKDRAGKHWHMYTPPEHLNYFSSRFLDSYLGPKGFRLVKRIYTSGGMGGRIGSSAILSKLARKIIDISDHSPLNALPLFDHMYSYYAAKN
jgi:SAM-dependent methyltransferase